MLGGLMVLAGALIMALFVETGLQAALAFGLLTGIGASASGAFGAQPSVVQWFERRRALALAILYSAGSIGGFVAAPLLDEVIRAADGNWRAGWWLLVGLTLVSATIALIFVREKPADLGQEPGGGPPADAISTQSRREKPAFITSEAWTYREAVTSVRYWLMVLALAGGSAGLTLFLAHGLLHLRDLGHSPQTAAWSVSILTASTLLGKVPLALLGDRIDPRYVWAMTLIAFGAGLALVVNATGVVALHAAAVGIGFGFGGGLVCLMAVLSNYYGLPAFASLAGLAAAVNTSISFFGPLVGGRLYDELGSYAPTFYALAAWCFAGAIVLLIMRRPVRRALTGSPGIEATAAPRDG